MLDPCPEDMTVECVSARSLGAGYETCGTVQVGGGGFPGGKGYMLLWLGHDHGASATTNALQRDCSHAPPTCQVSFDKAAVKGRHCIVVDDL